MAEPALKIRKLCKKYGERMIFDHLDIDIAHGELLGLMGGSGGGKSTILKTIIGLTKPDEGEIWFESQDLTKLSERQLAIVRPRIGYVFQDGALFDSLTVEENLSYPLQKHAHLSEEEVHRRVNERLESVSMAHTNSLYPNELSGGMRKRAGLMRATMLRPRLVLFDEPTAGLDPIVIKNLLEQIRDYRKSHELSGIFVAHDISIVLAVCDRVGILWEGKLRIESAKTILKSEDPIVRSFVRPAYEEAYREQAS